MFTSNIHRAAAELLSWINEHWLGKLLCVINRELQSKAGHNVNIWAEQTEDMFSSPSIFFQIPVDTSSIICSYSVCVPVCGLCMGWGAVRDTHQWRGWERWWRGGRRVAPRLGHPGNSHCSEPLCLRCKPTSCSHSHRTPRTWWSWDSAGNRSEEEEEEEVVVQR